MWLCLFGDLQMGGEENQRFHYTIGTMFAGLPWIFGNRAFHIETVALFHTVNVLRHRPTWVGLDDEVHETRLVYVAIGISCVYICSDCGYRTLIAGWCIRSDGWLLILRAFVLCDKRARNGQAAHSIFAVELESESLCVVVDIVHLV
jgi:hypothetical protein